MLAELPTEAPLYKLKCVAPGGSSGFFSSEECEDICLGRISNENLRLLRYIVATAGGTSHDGPFQTSLGTWGSSCSRGRSSLMSPAV